MQTSDNVALFGGAHIRKGSGICCCIHDTLMNMQLCMHVYIMHGECVCDTPTCREDARERKKLDAAFLDL